MSSALIMPMAVPCFVSTMSTSPGFIPRESRISFGITTCPLVQTVTLPNIFTSHSSPSECVFFGAIYFCGERIKSMKKYT